MTAINVIRQRAAVHVLTDGAGYRSDGALAFTAQKVFPIMHLNAVIATRGLPQFAPMFAYHANIRATGFDHLRSLALEVAKEEFLKAAATTPAPNDEFDLVIAGWSGTNGPVGYTLCNHGRNGFEPWQVVDLGEISLSPHDQRIKAELDFAYPNGVAADDFDPIADGLRVLEIQRKHPVEHVWEGQSARTQSAVGAFAQLTTITADAITTRIIRRWADEIGQPIGGSRV